MIAIRVFDKTPIWLRMTNFDKSNAYINVCGIHNKDESDFTFNEKDGFKDKSTKDKNEVHLKTNHDGMINSEEIVKAERDQCGY
jgi:hypothetical protein